MTGKYTCQDYRAEMTLLGLKRRLIDKTLAKEEKEALVAEIKKIEKDMGLD
ncbi:MAG: hypothetical protein JEZ02_12130 [Desulfatibacillum sp.]|nr:hypothetical protein [Desulfatibacillum sp.]